MTLFDLKPAHLKNFQKGRAGDQIRNGKTAGRGSQRLVMHVQAEARPVGLKVARCSFTDEYPKRGFNNIFGENIHPKLLGQTWKKALTRNCG